MATRQQIEVAERQRKVRTAKAITSFVTSPISTRASKAPGAGWGLAVKLFGTLGIAAYQIVTGRKFQVQMAKEQKAISKAHGTVNEILEVIQQAGFQLIDQGARPGTSSFEQEMVKQLYDVVGYKGQCNADIRTSADPKYPKAKRRLLFSVRERGTKLIPSPGFKAHPYLESYWSAQCRNIRDSWMEVFREKLVIEGRFRELEQLEADLNRGTKIARIALGGVGMILLIFLIRNSMKMET